MIVCVLEMSNADDDHRLAFIDTGLALTSVQKKYVGAITEALTKKSRTERIPRGEACISHEEDDEIARMEVTLPQRVEADVTLYVG